MCHTLLSVSPKNIILILNVKLQNIEELLQLRIRDWPCHATLSEAWPCYDLDAVEAVRMIETWIWFCLEYFRYEELYLKGRSNDVVKLF